MTLTVYIKLQQLKVEPTRRLLSGQKHFKVASSKVKLVRGAASKYEYLRLIEFTDETARCHVAD